MKTEANKGQGSRVCAGGEKAQNGGGRGATEFEIVVPRRSWGTIFL